MKQLSLILCALFIMGMSFTSCKKCKDCTATVTVGGSSTTTDLGEYCGDDLKAIDGETETTELLGISTTTSWECK